MIFLMCCTQRNTFLVFLNQTPYFVQSNKIWVLFTIFQFKMTQNGIPFSCHFDTSARVNGKKPCHICTDRMNEGPFRSKPRNS